MSHAIEIEACEWLRLVLDSLETRAGGFAGCGLGLAVCGPVLLTAPPKNRPTTRRAYRYVDMRAGLSSTEGRPVGPAGHRSGLTSGAAKEAMTFAPI